VEARIEIPFRGAKDAKAALKVLKSEMLSRSRSKAAVQTKGASLIVGISAADLPALRASINTYLRLVSVIITGLEA